MFKTQFSSAWMRLLCLVALALCFGGVARAQSTQTTASIFALPPQPEGADQQFRVTLTNAATRDLTLRFSTSPRTAMELPGGPFQADYNRIVTDITIRAGRSEIIVPVPTRQDTTYEFDETFVAQISFPRFNGQDANNVGFGINQATGIILNDDNPPAITLVAPPSGILEGDRNNLTRQNLNFTISIDSIAERPLNVVLTTENGSARAVPPGATNSDPAQDADGNPADFIGTDNNVFNNPNPTPTNNRRLNEITLAAGTRQQQFPIVILGDDAYEGDEAFTLNAVATNPGPGGNNVVSRSSVIGVIIDNDLPTYVIDASQAAVVEGREAVFRINLVGRDGNPISAKQQIDFTYIYQDVNATFGTDPNDRSGNTDYIDSGAGANSTGVAPATPGVQGRFSIPIGGNSAVLRVQTIDDNAEEQIETYRLIINSATNTLAPAGTGNVANGTIFDNDSAPVVSIGSAFVTEGTNVPNFIEFTVSLSSVTSQIVTVDYETVTPAAPIPVGTATPGADYTPTTTPVTLQFGPGEPQATFRIPIVADSLNEPDEVFQVRLSNPTNASFGGGAAAILATGTIIDDDPAGVISMGQTQIDIAENGGTVRVPVTFTPSLTPDGQSFVTPARPVVVDFATAEGTAFQSGQRDYFGKVGRLTFEATATTQTQVIEVQIIDDRIREGNEDFTVNITNVSGATLNPDAAVTTVVILDNEAPPLLRIAPVNGRYIEGSGIQRVNVTLLSPSQTDVRVNYAFINGDGNPNNTEALNAATNTEDYDGVNGTLVFTAGGPTSIPIEFTIKDDGTYEPNELFTIRLSNATDNFTFERNVTSAVLTIVENDAAPGLTIGNATVAEGNMGTIDTGNVLTFEVTLDKPSKFTTTFTYSTLNLAQADCKPSVGCDVASDDDYNSVRNVPVTIAPGATAATITVRVAPDTRNEYNEQFALIARSLVNVQPSVTRTTTGELQFGTVAYGIITNDDAGGVITIGAPTVNAVESYKRNANDVVLGNAVEFPVTLPTVPGRPVTVNYTLTGTATAFDVEDLTTGPGRGRVTFFAGDPTRVISFRAKEDNLVEGLESLRVTISIDDRNGANSYTAGGQSATAQTQIVDRTPRVNQVAPTIGFPAYGGSPAVGNAPAVAAATATNVVISGVSLRTDGNPRVTAVIFNGAVAERNVITYNTDNSLTVPVPRNAKSGPITLRLVDGTTIVSKIGAGTTATDPNLPTFVVQPVIDSFSPTTGVPGATVLTLLGVNFNDPLNPITAVQFNGASAPIAAGAVTNDNRLQVRVPQGATNGAIRIVTQNGGVGPLSQVAFTTVNATTGGLRFGDIDRSSIVENSGNRNAAATDLRDVARNFDGVANNTPHRPYQVFLVPARQSGGAGDGTVLRPSSSFTVRFRVLADPAPAGTDSPTIVVRGDLNNLGRFNRVESSKQDSNKDGAEDGFVDYEIPANYDVNNPFEVFISYAGRDNLPPVAGGSSASVRVEAFIINSTDALYPNTAPGNALFATVARNEVFDNTNQVAIAFNANSTNSFSVPFSTDGSGSVAQTDVFNVPPVRSGMVRNYTVYRFNAAGQLNNRNNDGDFIALGAGERLQRGVGYRLVVGDMQVQLRTRGAGLQVINDRSFSFNLTRNVPFAANASSAANATNGYNFIGFPFNNTTVAGVNFNNSQVTFNGATRTLDDAASAGLINRQLFRADAAGNLVPVTGDPIIRPFEAYFVQIYRDNVTLTLNAATPGA